MRRAERKRRQATQTQYAAQSAQSFFGVAMPAAVLSSPPPSAEVLPSTHTTIEVVQTFMEESGSESSNSPPPSSPVDASAYMSSPLGSEPEPLPPEVPSLLQWNETDDIPDERFEVLQVSALLAPNGRQLSADHRLRMSRHQRLRGGKMRQSSRDQVIRYRSQCS